MKTGSDTPENDSAVSDPAAVGGRPPDRGSGPAAPDARAGRAGTGQPDAALTFDDWDEAPLPDSEIADLFLALEKTTRARRLYEENNPVLRGFVAGARAAFGRLWDRVPSLTVSVEEEAFRCFGKEFPSREGREGLPFMFYRDGVRVLTFLPGFEEEIELFLHVIDRARQMGPRASDDIVTLLWEEEFSAFQYSYVDLLAAGEIAPQPTEEPEAVETPPSVSRERLERVVAGEEPEPPSPAVEAGEPPVAQIASPDRWVETTYFLEPGEVDKLYEAVRAEWNRDVRGAVLDALFDNLEDASVADRHSEIIRILGQLLPAFLARGDLANVTKILIEVAEVAEDPALGAEEREEIEQLRRELGEAQVLSQFLGSVEEGTIDPSDEELSLFISYLGADALPLLIRTIEKSESNRLREKLAPALDMVGQKHGRALSSLVGESDEKLAYGAARIAGRIRLRAATNNLIALMRRPDLEGRRIATDALASLGDPSALDALQEALADADREIRIAAARGLSAMKTPSARDTLKAIIRGRGIRFADLTEQIAVFEAFGNAAVDEDVAALDRILNGRRLLGRESPEIRSCAAMALGRIGSVNARTALLTASKDDNPLVRNAVTKALAETRPT